MEASCSDLDERTAEQASTVPESFQALLSKADQSSAKAADKPAAAGKSAAVKVVESAIDSNNNLVSELCSVPNRPNARPVLGDCSENNPQNPGNLLDSLQANKPVIAASLVNDIELSVGNEVTIENCEFPIQIDYSNVGSLAVNDQPDESGGQIEPDDRAIKFQS